MPGDVIRDTLDTVIGWHLQELIFKLGASTPLAPEDVLARDWQRDLKTRGYQIVVAPLTADSEPAQNSALALTLRDLAAVADGDVRGGPEGDDLAVQDMTQSVAEALFARPGTAGYDVPPEWWATGVGRLCRLALAVATGDDDLMPIAEAAAQLGVSVQAVTNAIASGRVQAVSNPDSRSERQGRRLVFRAEVERWQREREGR